MLFDSVLFDDNFFIRDTSDYEQVSTFRVGCCLMLWMEFLFGNFRTAQEHSYPF